jgi:hypothetical protein
MSTDNDGDWICSDCIRTCERCEWVGTHDSDWYSR